MAGGRQWGNRRVGPRNTRLRWRAGTWTTLQRGSLFRALDASYGRHRPVLCGRPTGTLYATWQDVRFSKGKRTDVLVTSSRDQGRSWSPPVRANDTPAGAQDAFTPAVAVNSRGTVGILYYDLRDDTSTKDGSFMTAEWFTTAAVRGRRAGA